MPSFNDSGLLTGVAVTLTHPILILLIVGLEHPAAHQSLEGLWDHLLRQIASEFVFKLQGTIEPVGKGLDVRQWVAFPYALDSRVRGNHYGAEYKWCQLVKSSNLLTAGTLAGP